MCYIFQYLTSLWLPARGNCIGQGGGLVKSCCLSGWKTAWMICCSCCWSALGIFAGQGHVLFSVCASHVKCLSEVSLLVSLAVWLDLYWYCWKNGMVLCWSGWGSTGVTLLFMFQVYWSLCDHHIESLLWSLCWSGHRETRGLCSHWGGNWPGIYVLVRLEVISRSLCWSGGGLPGELVLVKLRVFLGSLCTVRFGGGLWSLSWSFLALLESLCWSQWYLPKDSVLVRSAGDLWAVHIG